MAKEASLAEREPDVRVQATTLERIALHEAAQALPGLCKPIQKVGWEVSQIVGDKTQNSIYTLSEVKSTEQTPIRR
eukprot:2277811-Amphidinium_carterae.1